MKKVFFCTFALVLLIVACNKQPKTTNTDIEEPVSDFVNVDLENLVFDQSNDLNNVSVRVIMELPKSDNDALTKIRKSIISLVDDKSYSPQNSVDNYLKRNVFDCQDFTVTFDMLFSDMRWRATDSISANLISQYFIQYQEVEYFYCKSNIGEWLTASENNIRYYVFDLTTGNRLTEKDLFTDVSKIVKLLQTEAYNNFLRDNRIPEDESYINSTDLTANGNFKITSDRIVYQYSIKEVPIADSSEGISVYINKDSLKPYVKESSVLYKYWFGE